MTHTKRKEPNYVSEAVTGPWRQGLPGSYSVDTEEAVPLVHALIEGEFAPEVRVGGGDDDFLDDDDDDDFDDDDDEDDDIDDDDDL